MKFKDKKTGKIYKTIAEARFNYCLDKKCDSNCELPYTRGHSGGCAEFCAKHPKQAAEIMGFEIIEDTAEKITRQSILDDAKRCVCGDRDQQYGSPENSFAAIGALWGEYLWHKYGLGKSVNAVGINFITPEDVAAMMVLFKCARIATGQNKADNWVDIAGYAACGGEIGGNE